MESTFTLTNKQSKVFNILKVIFAILVVYNHANIVTTANFDMNVNIPEWLDLFKYSISGIVCGCAVDGFFLISSILLYRKTFDWLTNIKKKIKTLLVPYFSISIIVVAFCLLFENLSITKPFFGHLYSFSNYDFVDWLHAFGFGFHCPLNGPLWFLRNLFVLNLLSKLIKKTIDKFPKLYLAFIIIFTVFCEFNFLYFLYPIDLLFWSLGYYIVKYNINIDCFNNKKIFIFIVYIITFVFKLYITYFIESPEFLMSLSNILNFTIEILLIYSFVSTHVDSKYIKSLELIYPYNFYIYVFHYLPLRFIMRFIIKYFPSNPLSIIIEFLIIPILVIIIIIIFVSKILKKIMPKTLYIITGYRS